MHPQSQFDAVVREHERATAQRMREHQLTLRRRERSLPTSTRTSTRTSIRTAQGRSTTPSVPSAPRTQRPARAAVA